MKIGELDKRVYLRRYSKTTNSDGDIVEGALSAGFECWAKHANSISDFTRSRSTNTNEEYLQRFPTSEGVFVVRYCSESDGLHAKDVIEEKVSGVRWDIIGVVFDPPGRPEFIYAFAERNPSAGTIG